MWKKRKKSLICCEANNVDFFGLIFYKKSPRNINRTKAKQLVGFPAIKPVGVFVNHEINDLKNIIRLLNLKYIQLHGDENQSYINEIKNDFNLKIIKNFNKNQSDLKKINDIKNIDYLLFDYKSKIKFDSWRKF